MCFMAGIDHTIIAFKNGMLLRKTSVNKPDGSCAPLIPFSYSRDGEIRGYEMLGYNQTPSKGRVRSALKGIFRRHDRSDKTYFFYADKDVEIILVKSEEYCATFYLDWQNTYVLLGGYGHHRNPYTHFYHRGYGEQFERKMAYECYRWLCSDVLAEALLYSPAYYSEYEHHLLRLQLRLGYRDVFDVTFDDRPNNPDGLIQYYEPQENEPHEALDRKEDMLWPICPNVK